MFKSKLVVVALVAFIGTAFSVSVTAVAIGQTSPSASLATLGQQVRIDAFESHQRGDNYGVATFMVLNETDKPLNSIELTCWMDNDRSRGTTVLVWPTPDPVAAHTSRQFSKVNIGLVAAHSRPACEVTKVD